MSGDLIPKQTRILMPQQGLIAVQQKNGKLHMFERHTGPACLIIGEDDAIIEVTHPEGAV